MNNVSNLSPKQTVEEKKMNDKVEEEMWEASEENLLLFCRSIAFISSSWATVVKLT